MKKWKKISGLILGGLGIIGIGISVSFLTTSCSSKSQTPTAFDNQINNQTHNSQTALIKNLSVGLKQTYGNTQSFATGFVFDQDQMNPEQPKLRNSPVDLLSTFYVMTNYHFYADLNPYLLNSSHLAVGSVNGNESTINNWYTLENVNLNCAQTDPNGDVYVLHNPELKTVYDIAVYKLEVNLQDPELPTAFSYFNNHKTELKYNTQVLTNTSSKNIITTGGYPYLNQTSSWNQYSNQQVMSNIIMDPLLSNYPVSNGYSFNNELVYAVKGMLIPQGASGSLVLNNSDNALAGIYFGFIAGENHKSSYGIYIPFVAENSYFHVTLKYQGQDCYFNIVNLNQTHDLTTQSSPWIDNDLYQVKNYNNLINNQLFKTPLTANATPTDVLQTLNNNNDLHLSLTMNGNDKVQLVAKDISLEKLLKQAQNIQISLVNNQQNIWQTWINNLNSVHPATTYLTQLFTTNAY